MREKYFGFLFLKLETPFLSHLTTSQCPIVPQSNCLIVQLSHYPIVLTFYFLSLFFAFWESFIFNHSS